MVGSQPGLPVSKAVSTAVSAGGSGPEAFDFAAVGEAITKRFAASATDFAASIAAVQGDAILTYAELDRRSNQLARYFGRHGVGAGSVTALHAGPSIAALIAMLATLKTGAAYAPLDPTAPPAYLRSVLRDCGAGLVLSAGRPEGACEEVDWPVTAIGLDAALAASAAESDAALEDGNAPHDIAYIMYTSGSTGRPKGVPVPHRAVVRLVSGQSYARFAADEVVLHAAPLAFDASTFEIWGALLHGARIVAVPDGRASLSDIADTIQRHGVTTAWFTAGLFNLLVEHKLASLRGLRQILAGGDVLSPSHVARAQAALPDCQLVNGYGPTENTTFTCCYRIPREGWGGGPVPIGTPIAGTYVRLLDDEMRPVPDGEIGMLHAGGLGLASGYLGDPRLSAAAFVADPLHEGATVYRTGDLARRRPDGAFDFIGRRDLQVKIDGKRVELGEIEETLRRGDKVADAAAILSGEGVLVGYIKPAAGGHDTEALVAQARLDLLRDLPAHMRPSRLVVLEAFPLTANGKIDRARLPVPPPLETGAPAIATDTTEQALSEILSRVLGLPAIGVETNFFDLGATSLKLVEAHAAIERLHPGVGLVTLFQYPTVRALARSLGGSAAPADAAIRHRAQQQAEALRRMRQARQAATRSLS